MRRKRRIGNERRMGDRGDEERGKKIRRIGRGKGREGRGKMEQKSIV